MPGVGRNRDFISLSQEHAGPQNLQQKLTLGHHSDLIKGVTVILDLLPGLKDVFEGFQALGLEHHLHLGRAGNLRGLPSVN